MSFENSTKSILIYYALKWMEHHTQCQKRSDSNSSFQFFYNVYYCTLEDAEKKEMDHNSKSPLLVFSSRKSEQSGWYQFIASGRQVGAQAVDQRQWKIRNDTISCFNSLGCHHCSWSRQKEGQKEHGKETRAKSRQNAERHPLGFYSHMVTLQCPGSH